MGGLFILCRCLDLGQRPASLPGDGRGSIPTSGEGKFTFRRVRMVYLDSPAAGARCYTITTVVFQCHWHYVHLL